MVLKSIEEVIKQKAKITGATVHLVDEVYDNGPVILQESVEVSDNDTPESLQEKVLKLEHKLYPEAIKLFETGKYSLKNSNNYADIGRIGVEGDLAIEGRARADAGHRGWRCSPRRAPRPFGERDDGRIRRGSRAVAQEQARRKTFHRATDNAVQIRVSTRPSTETVRASERALGGKAVGDIAERVVVTMQAASCDTSIIQLTTYWPS